MPRRLRIHVPGGFYHVTLRGNHQQAIFRAPSDRALLDSIVARSIAARDARVHAYCWMTNHLHLFIQVGEAPLGVVMRDIASHYARAYQAKLATTGHLFERRYHAKLVDVENYLFAVLRYVHMNPVKDGLVRRVGDYPWSSHRAYAGVAPPPPWLHTDFILAMFACRRRKAQLAYRRFIAEDSGEAICPGLDSAGCDVLGDDDFTARVRNTPVAPRKSGPSVQQLIEQVCAERGLASAALRSASRAVEVVQARAWVAAQALRSGSATLAEVARALGRDRATLRHAMRRYPNGRLAEDKAP